MAVVGTVVLSQGIAVTYKEFLAYNPCVDDFGGRFRKLREARHLKAIDVARAGYANKDVTDERIVYFAGYIGRIERGEPNSQNPKLDVLERLARGCGFPSLTQFVEQMEGLQSGAAAAHKGTVAEEAVSDATAPVAASATIDTRDLPTYVLGLVDGILNRSNRAERERKAATRARKKPKRRKPARTVTRRRG